MAPVTRTTSQIIATSGLPAEITSIAQLNSVISALLSNTVPSIDLTGLNITAASLTPSTIQATTKAALPAIAKALKAASAQTSKLTKLQRALQLILRFITSSEYQIEIVKSMLDRGLFDELIEAKLEERLADGSRGGTGAIKARKRRDPALEEHMHYIVNKMVHRRYSKKGRVVVSDMIDWPAPVQGGRETIEIVAGTFEEVWRPQWHDFSANLEFIDEFLAQVEEEFPDQHAEDDLRASLSVFFGSIQRGRVDQASGKREEVKLQQNRSGRATSLLGTMTSQFDASLLNKCRERNFFRQAFTSGGVFISPLTYKDQHHLPQLTTPLPDGGEAGYDGFWLFADLWTGTKTLEGADVFAIRDVEWWSPLLALGFYVLYVQSAPAPGQRPRTPIFHVPPPFRLQASLESLPELPAPAGPADNSTRPAKRAKTKAKTKITTISRGMVNDHILNDPAYSIWCLGLVEDAPVDDTSANLPTLQELLADASNRATALAARAHLRVLPERDIEVYRSLWRLRNEGLETEYRQALVSGDLEGHLEGIDWANIGLYE